MNDAIPAAGVPEPVEVRIEVDKAFDALREAMRNEDEEAIREGIARLRKVYGPWAGVPERRPAFASPPDAATPVTRERLARLWEIMWQHAHRNDRGNGRYGLPADHPEAEHVVLRHTAYAIDGGLAALKYGYGDRDEIRERIDRALDYLLSVQRDNGLFPFPDVRGWHKHFGPPLQSLYDMDPQAFDHGWVIEDHGDGGLQFDNGVCAAILIEAWAQLGDERYREAAQRACHWATQRPIVVNFNYNAFSVWAMARYVEVTGDTGLLSAAVKRARLGILPGQLPGGRWVDRHNARTVYHGIILRALATLYRVLPADDGFRPELKKAFLRAEETILDELYQHGASDADHSLTGVCAASLALGRSGRREGAIRIMINAMIDQEVDRRFDVVDDLTLFAVGQAIEWFESKSAGTKDSGERRGS